ncbi:hypothetical protein [Ensifer soli]|uniref:hypothetical protein n=1 Tax=Ciceribacter sp. sgz301302 TaxID=3342379 RepID=UPI0035B81BAA
MKRPVRAAGTALLITATVLAMPAGRARADEPLLIWSPSKIASQGYRLRMGMRTPTAADISAGVDLSLRASTSGRIREIRDSTRLWAEVADKTKGGRERSAAAGYNPMTGRGSANAGVSRRWAISPSFDIVLAPSVALDLDVAHGRIGRARMTQKAQIRAVGTGTSLTASGTAITRKGGIGAELGVEQRLFDGLSLGAAFRRQEAATTGALQARLRLDW